MDYSEELFFFLIALIFAFFLIAPLVALVKISRLKQRVFDLEDKNLTLKQLVEKVVDSNNSTQNTKRSNTAVLKQQDLPEARSSKSETSEALEMADHKLADNSGVVEKENETKKLASSPDIEPQIDPSGSLEENIASKWFVWIGAGAIALSGLFLVKYIAEQGILTPAVRMLLAFAMGSALAIGGEWVRRKPIQKAIASLKPNYIPMALTASGLFTMFASVYAAFALYHLLPPFIAFALMAAVSVLAFGLSVLQGAPVAVLGLVGGLITPLLIQTGNPSAVGLFGYLSIVIASCVAVLRYRPWWWLGFVAVAGSGLWVLVWSVTEFQKGDEIVIALFFSLVVALFGLIVGVEDEQDGDKAYFSNFASAYDLNGYRIVAVASAVVASIVYLVAFSVGHASTTGLAMLAWLAFAITALAYVRPRLVIVLIPALGTVLFAFALWGLVAGASGIVKEVGFDQKDIWGPDIPKMVSRYIRWAAGFATAFAIGGYFIASKHMQPLLWILVSIIAPLGLLVITYLTFHSLYPDRNWALAGLLGAMASLVAASLIKRSMSANPNEVTDNLPLGLYAAGVVSGLSLTFVFLLQDAWLTVALSLQLPAIAWLSNQLKIDFLRKVAMVIVIGLFARLALNPFLFEYAKSHYLGEHWVLYGYGIPALTTYIAARWFRLRKDDRLVSLLEGLYTVFLVLLISAEIRIVATGSIDTPRLSLLEGGMQAIAWLVVAWSRLRQYTIDGRLMDKWSGLVLFAMGAGMALISNLIIHNPAFNSEHVGNLPIFNTLLLAFAIPGVLMWVNSRLPLKHMSKNPNNSIIGVGVLVLLFSYITLETRHAFQGGVLAFARPSEGEIYTYSVVWLVFAFALLMYGLLKKRVVSRYAALLVLVITVLKVFLSDMSGLEGLWRVASFLGLGLSLVAIGYLYQRFLYLPKPAEKSGVKTPNNRSPTK